MVLCSLLCLSAARRGYAGSATWSSTPGSGTWNVAGNWTPASIPNSGTDVATFGTSNMTSLVISADTDVSGIIFNANASSFTINVGAGHTLSFDSTGVTNNSGTTQNFATAADGSGNYGKIDFKAGTMAGGANVVYTNSGSSVFENSSNAGSATFINNSSATVSGSGGATVFLGGTAGSGTFINNSGTAANLASGNTQFYFSTNAGHGNFINNGGTAAGAAGGYTYFAGDVTSTAGSGTYINNAATGSSAFGGSTIFAGFSTAGNGVFTNNGVAVSGISAGAGGLSFSANSTAGNATITNKGSLTGNSAPGGSTQFFNSSSGGSATITNEGSQTTGGLGGGLGINGNATLGFATVINQASASGTGNGGQTNFGNLAMGGTATITNNAATLPGFSTAAGVTNFNDSSNADHITITSNAAGVAGVPAGETMFWNSSSAGSGTFIANGSTVNSGSGGIVSFVDNSSASSATLIANGGTNGGAGGVIGFSGTTSGGTARVELFGNSTLKMAFISTGSLGIGSIEGSGTAFIGAKTLAVGGNNLSTVFSGVILDSGSVGSVIKTGTGDLTLSGVNTYTGSTSITSGRLIVNGNIATGNTVSVSSAAVLAGSGTIGSAVSVAGGGIFQPGSGSAAGTLTVGSLTFTNTSLLSYFLGSPGVVGGANNSLGIVTGNLTLDGTLLLNNTVAAGTYRLLTYSGSLTNNTLDVANTGSNASGTFTVQTSVAGQVNLIVTTSATSAGGNATWLSSPGSGDWNTSANWTSGSVPNGASSTAFFATSGSTAVSLSGSTQVNTIVFNAGASAFTITAPAGQTLSISGTGVINSSGTVQKFVAGITGSSSTSGTIAFFNSAIAGGTNVSYETVGSASNVANSPGGILVFNNISTSGSAAINNDGSTTNSVAGGMTIFNGTSNAGFSLITNKGSSTITFNNTLPSGATTFNSFSSAANATINNNGSTSGGGGIGYTTFNDNSTSGSATINNLGGSTSGFAGGGADFEGNSSAGHSIINNQSGTGANASGGITTFSGSSGTASAGFATINNFGSANSGNGGGYTLFGGGLFNGNGPATLGNATMNNSGASGTIGQGGHAMFMANTTAGSGTINNLAGSGSASKGGYTQFTVNATAANSLINNSAGANAGELSGSVQFSGSSTAANATINNLGGTSPTGSSESLTIFMDTSSAGSAVINNNAGTGTNAFGGFTSFTGTSSAASATITSFGAALASARGGETQFNDTTTAGSGTITAAGATSATGNAGETELRNSSSAGNATLIANGGTNGGPGGSILFQNTATGGTARIIANGNGFVNISQLTSGSIGFGSIEGSGSYNLGANTLATGALNTSTTVSGVLSGTGGSLVKIGSGTFALSGTNTYTGSTIVNAGELKVNGALSGSSNVLVNAGAALSGTGNIAGTVTFANNAILGPGNSPGTITVGALILSSTTQVNYQLATAGVVGNGVNDLTVVTGDLTLDGVLNITDAGGFGIGTYRLFNYNGTLTDNTLSIGTTPGGFLLSQFSIQSGSGEVNLIVSGTGVSGAQYWDGTNTVANGVVNGGSGSWDNVTTNWTNASGSANNAWVSGTAIFSGSSANVSIVDNIHFTALEFDTSGYSISGSASNSLIPTGTAAITTGTNILATISAQITGTGALSKLGSGTLQITGSNSYSGGTTLNAGTLAVDDDHALGSGTLTVNAGTIANDTGNVSIANNIAVKGNSFSVAPAAGSGTMAFNGNVDLGGTMRTITNLNAFTEVQFNGVISNGGLTLIATGFIGDYVLGGTAANTYTGTTIVGDNVCLELDKSVTNGAIIGDLVINGSATPGVVKLEASDQIADTSNVTVNSAGNFTFGGFNLNGFNETIGSLSGTGTVQLNDNLIFSGSTAGTFTIGSGSFAGKISDAGVGGKIVKTGSGTLQFTGSNSYNGGTTIAGGILAVVADNNLGATTGGVTFDPSGSFATVLRTDAAVTFDAARTFNITGANTGVIDTNSFDSTINSKITGYELLKAGAGKLTITGTADSYTRSYFSGGTVAVSDVSQLGSSFWSFDGGTLEATQGISSNVSIVLGSTPGDFGTGLGDATFYADAATTSTLGGTIYGFGPFTKDGPGTLILSGISTYGGATTVKSGTLQAGSATAFSAASAFKVNSGATLDVGGFFTTIGSLSDGTSGGGLVTNSGTSAVALTTGSDNTNTSFSGQITDGNGSLTLHKVGTGTMTLTGSFANHELNVSGGALILNGTTAGFVQVDNAVFGGNATIAGSLSNNGTVSPGNSPGIINVGGNYDQSANGSLIIQIAGFSAGQFDLLAVTGTANLDGALHLQKLGNFQIHAGDNVTFLTTGGGVSGTFATADTGSLLNAIVVYDSNDVKVVFTQGSFTPRTLPALTPNQSAVGRNLNLTGGDPRNASLVTYLDNQPLALIPNDYDFIAPEELSALYEISFASAMVQKQNLEDRMQDVRNGLTGFVSSLYLTDTFNVLALGSDGKTVVGDGKAGKDVMRHDEDNRWGVFVSGNGDFVNIDGDFNARGYDFTTGGVTLGVDYRLRDDLVVGVAFDYAHTWTDLAYGGKIEADGAKLGVYATWFRDGFYANAYAGGGYNSFDTRRIGLAGPANGSTNGGEFNTFLGGGYDFHRGAWTFGPTFSLAYMYSGIAAYTENGSLAPLRVIAQGDDSFRTDLGWQVIYAGKIRNVAVTPRIKAGWEHEFGDTALPVDAQLANGAGSTFLVHGPATGRDSALLEAGVSVQWKPGISTYLIYDARLNSTYQSHSITGGMSFSF